MKFNTYDNETSSELFYHASHTMRQWKMNGNLIIDHVFEFG